MIVRELSFIGIAVVFLVIIIVGMVVMRSRLGQKSRRLDEEIADLCTDAQRTDDGRGKEEAIRKNKEISTDIEAVIAWNFADHYIRAFEKEALRSHFGGIFNEVTSFVRKLEFFRIAPSDKILKLINDFESIDELVRKHNEAFIQDRLESNKDFFDHCLKYPLDEQQRRSIVSEEDNCLVVSSAGSGKTSSIVGKVKYLIEKNGIAPERILLISYTHKAAMELTERVGVEGLSGYTFHKLAIDLIGKSEGIKPSICDNTDALFIKIYRQLLNNRKFPKAVMGYFVNFQVEETGWDARKSERRRDLAEQKAGWLKALLPDMDGNPVYVRSEQERKICFVLSSLGVKYRYEEPYEHQVSDETHSQYKPDFSIYFEEDGMTKRVYLEHYAVDEHGLVPTWFAKDRQMTYEEANAQYGDGITWKRAVHEKHKTRLIATSSADFYYADIRKKLKAQLSKAGVPIEEKMGEELYDLVLPRESKQEKAFIRLIATFVTLLKSSCLSIQEVLKQAERADDRRSIFMIKNIFRPVYEAYVSALQQSGQIDFTDAILKATQICRSSRPLAYDYIIVDEFQDISVDRYHFLKALREGNPPAKLYCVGDDWQSIYRFSGSDMSLFNQFANYFGATEINKIETTYRFGEPLVGLSSKFIQRNKAQISKSIHPFSPQAKTELKFYAYERHDYCMAIGELVAALPADKSVFLLGRYSFDDYYLSFMYKGVKEGDRYYYFIGNRKIEFLTVHKSKGLEADYVILLQCNKDTYGFPSQINDDPVLNLVLTKSDQFPYGEERRLFYVAITRAKAMTIVLYDKRFPSVFVDEFLNPEKVTQESYAKHPNANKVWTRGDDKFLLTLYKEGKNIKYISGKMGRSQTAIIMRLGKLGVE